MLWRGTVHHSVASSFARNARISLQPVSRPQGFIHVGRLRAADVVVFLVVSPVPFSLCYWTSEASMCMALGSIGMALLAVCFSAS